MRLSYSEKILLVALLCAVLLIASLVFQIYELQKEIKSLKAEKEKLRLAVKKIKDKSYTMKIAVRLGMYATIPDLWADIEDVLEEVAQ